MRGKRYFIWGAAIAAFVVGIVAEVSWAGYPERPITLIVIYGAGGSADLGARALAKAAEKILGQPIVALNKVGASGTIGVGATAAAKPDGYTIGETAFGALSIAPHMVDVPYNPLKDVEHILGFARILYGPAVRSDSQFKTLKDLVQYARANPGKIKYSSAGLAVANHFGMVHLAKAEGIKWELVVFKETTEAVTACLGGHVDIVSQTPTNIVPLIRAGKLRLLASLSEIRWPWAPDVPTARELGYNFHVVSYYGLATPKGVSKPILDKLRDAFKKAIDDPEFVDTMNNKLYLHVHYRNPEQFQKMVEVEYKENEAMLLELGLHKSQKK